MQVVTEDTGKPKAKAVSQGRQVNKPRESKLTASGKVMGRPELYSEKLAEELCDRLASGRSLNSVCKDDDMPCYKTVMRWDRDNEDFSQKYARARHERGLHYGDKISETIDDVIAGTITPDQARIALDGYKWISARLANKVYGDKQEVAVNHTVKIAEEHAAALIELSRRKREATKMIDVTPTLIGEDTSKNNK